MDPIVFRVVARHKIASPTSLWEGAVAALQTFNQRYDEVQRLREPLDERGKELLYAFAFRKNGTAPSFDSPFKTWMSKCVLTMNLDDPDAFRVNGAFILEVHDGKKPLSEFLSRLEVYKDALQAIVNASTPEKFNYQGFGVSNYEHIDEDSAMKALEGVDYLVALFKTKGMEHLLKKGVQGIQLVPDAEDWAGLYMRSNQIISLNVRAIINKGAGRFIKWVNEVFLHEFGHYIHLNYISGEAKEVWDSGWTEVSEKKELLKVSKSDRLKMFEVLARADFDPSKASKKLPPAMKIKFGVWLRTPMTGDPLITDKQFRLTKAGQRVFSFFANPTKFLKDQYDTDPEDESYAEQMRRSEKQMRDKLGLLTDLSFSISQETLDEMVKADPAMKKDIDLAMEKLEIVSDYGQTNEREDFAETFVAFLAAPEKLTPTAKFRMQQALSLSGLYGKPVVRLAQEAAIIEAVVRRYLALV